MTLHALPYGDQAWLIECDGDPLALAQWLRAQPWPSAAEVVAGARTCLVRFGGAAPDRAAMEGRLVGWPDQPRTPASEAPPAVIRVRYDGEDLSTVSHLTGLDAEQIVSLHTCATYRVAFLGFAPGFAYLTGLPAQLRVPRRSVPRVAVPAGAVAIADHYSAVYPRSSPGGWHLLGTSDDWLFDPRRSPPSRLRAGMAVRFEAAR